MESMILATKSGTPIIGQVAIPDTGLDLNTTPYILALGIVAAGAGVLLFRRRKRWN